jgi:heptosyltransferase II
MTNAFSVNLIKILDRVIGGVICSLLSVFSRKREIDVKKSKKILFIQLWGMGETILTLPAIAAAKKKFKDSEVSVLCTGRNSEVYRRSGLDLMIRETKMNPFSLKWLMIKDFKRYDICIDMEEYLNISSIISLFLGKQRIGYSHGVRASLYNERVKYEDNKHCTLAFMELVGPFGIKAEVKKIDELNCGKSEKNRISEILGGLHTNKKIVGIVAGAAESGKSRMWPKDRFIEIANNLIEKQNCFVLLIGSGTERQLALEIHKGIRKKESAKNLAGEIGISELFCLIKEIDLLITNDTGPLHIASAQQTRVIGLFGPNSPVRFGPFGNKAIVLYHPDSCSYSPCINVHKGQAPDCLFAKNSVDYQKCMKAISVEEVIAAARKLLG